ncbi:hypothetical protein MKY96_32710 [Paenibacillus sp. FSL R7-0302]|uniref:hypothetical protein n=1 Tax=Paenibacillus sp. FSL R7-0302 TaxID=2921681 RepID=UPI0030F7C823
MLNAEDVVVRVQTVRDYNYGFQNAVYSLEADVQRIVDEAFPEVKDYYEYRMITGHVLNLVITDCFNRRS